LNLKINQGPPVSLLPSFHCRALHSASTAALAAACCPMDAATDVSCTRAAFECCSRHSRRDRHSHVIISTTSLLPLPTALSPALPREHAHESTQVPSQTSPRWSGASHAISPLLFPFSPASVQPFFSFCHGCPIRAPVTDHHTTSPLQTSLKIGACRHTVAHCQHLIPGNRQTAGKPTFPHFVMNSAAGAIFAVASELLTLSSHL
jgi:hypothetical protein